MILIQSPLEQFEVCNLISVSAPVIGYLNLSLTNFSLYSILVFILVIGIHFLFKGPDFLETSFNTKLIPST
jgi:F-type H+-transporting ATPase subunit a